MIKNSGLVVVGSMDLTPHINQKSYTVESVRNYESWQDGNFNEHRIYTSQKVSGEFELFFANEEDYQAFKDAWASAVANNKVTVGVYVMNDFTFQAIVAYYDIKSIAGDLTVAENPLRRILVSIKEA